jgi:hypothetical protein
MTNRYVRAAKAIAAADVGSIRQRWEYGRLVLLDDTKTTPAGNLRNGAMAELIADERKAGRKASEREMQYRREAARAYPTEAQITQVLAQYENWWQLIQAGFPAFDAPPDAEPYDPRRAVDRARDAARDLANHGHGGDGQLALFEYFPEERFDETATLAELAKYASEMAELTERFAQRDRERFAYLNRLIAAVNGDMNATAGQAQAALDGQLPG